MHIHNVLLFLITLTSTASATFCFLNGLSVRLGAPPNNPFLRRRQAICQRLPLQNGGRGPARPAPAITRTATVTRINTVTVTTTQPSVSVSTTTSTTTSVSVQVSTTTATSTTTDTSTTTATTTTTDTTTVTSYGIDPVIATSAFSRCVGRNPTLTKPLFDSTGRPACCVPIVTTGANALPTAVC